MIALNVQSHFILARNTKQGMAPILPIWIWMLAKNGLQFKDFNGLKAK